MAAAIRRSPLRTTAPSGLIIVEGLYVLVQIGVLMEQNDSTQNPVQPQFPLGASSNEAYDHAQIVNAPTPEIGAITGRLSQQFSLPRSIPNYEMMDAEPATQTPTQWAVNPGT